MNYTFAVITRTATGAGNLAAALDVRQVIAPPSAKNGYVEQTVPIQPMVALNLRRPVFFVGEILILDESGREVGYPGRKPSKWDVEVEGFIYLNQAVARSREVFEESLRTMAAKDES